MLLIITMDSMLLLWIPQLFSSILWMVISSIPSLSIMWTQSLLSHSIKTETSSSPLAMAPSSPSLRLHAPSIKNQLKGTASASNYLSKMETFAPAIISTRKMLEAVSAMMDTISTGEAVVRAARPCAVPVPQTVHSTATISASGFTSS